MWNGRLRSHGTVELTHMPSILSFELWSLWGPLGMVTPVRPTDMPGVLLALQPGAVGPAPYPGSQSPSWAIPCCQVYGSCHIRDQGTGRHSSESTEWGPETQIGPRPRSVEHGHRLDAWGCLGHGARSGQRAASPLLLCYLSLTTGGLSQGWQTRREGVDGLPLIHSHRRHR